MSDINDLIEAMRQAAEAVPEGERVWRQDGCRAIAGPPAFPSMAIPARDANTAGHVAAACPANVLAVLDEVERLRSDMLDALSEAEACCCD